MSIFDGLKSTLPPVPPSVVSDGLSVDGCSVVSGWVGVGSGVGMTALTLAPLIVAESPLKLAYTFILPSDCTFDVLAGIEILPL